MKFLRVSIILKKKQLESSSNQRFPYLCGTFAKAAFHQLIRRLGKISMRFKPSVLDYLPKCQSWTVYCPILEEIRLQIDVLIA